MKPVKHNRLKSIYSQAPIRICDNGGWTDTWFAKHGQIFNIAVDPAVHVQINVYDSQKSPSRVVIDAANYGHRYTPAYFDTPHIRPTTTVRQEMFSQHPLLEAAIALMGIPDGLSIELRIYSDAPAGASTGTSAAVCVALIGALDKLNNNRLGRHEIAYKAHQVETELLEQQSGIQDQLAAAYGGINFIDMHQFPAATVLQLQPSAETINRLEKQLILVYFGQPHNSSAVHEMVIADLEDLGEHAPQIERLRQTAVLSRKAIMANDLVALGEAMIENHRAQADLHPDLINPAARKAVSIARRHKALGWKVNGAGGSGGSITILAPRSTQNHQQLLSTLNLQLPSCQIIPIKLNQTGLTVWIENP